MCSPAGRPGLSVCAISHAFGAEAVLSGVSFSLPAGQTGCVVGPSGCGKSTLLAIIGGLLCADAGRITHSGVRPAYVFQDPCLLPWRDARDNAAFGLSALPLDRRERRTIAERMLDEVGLAAADRRKFPRDLSGGMRQRVALARALAIDPDLLLLDEPFNALDLGLRQRMQQLVHRVIVARGLTAVLVTHDLAEAVKMADHVVVLSRRPASVAARYQIMRPWAARDDGFVQAEVGRLLADPAVARAFALEAAEEDSTAPRH